MKKTENRGLDFSGKVEERERDVDHVVGEMVEVIQAALTKATEYQEAQRRKSSAMANGTRERDGVGEEEEKEMGLVNQIEEDLTAALMLIQKCKAPTAMSSAKASGRKQIQEPDLVTKNLQLRFRSPFPDIFYTGNKAPAICVELIDKSTGHVVTAGPESSAILDVVAVRGDFDKKDDVDWTLEDFQEHEVMEDQWGRDGKKLLTDHLKLSLENGVGSLGELKFTDNSSWVLPTKRIRLGVKVASGICMDIRVREAISNPFVVKDRRGETCKKHDLPAPDDEVWRLKNIGRDGPFRKKLNEAGIFKVRDFIWKYKLSKEPLELRKRKILGTTMSKGRWEKLVEHAETCDLSGRYYVYHVDNSTKTSGVVFENIFELRCLIEGGECYPAEYLSDKQKVYADTWIREACDNACDSWKHIEEYHGPMPSDMKPSKKARFSPTDLATGAHTDQQVQGPAIGDPPVPFDQQVAGQSPSDGQVFEGFEAFTSIDDDPVLLDHSEQADGTIELCVEACKKHYPLTSDDEVWRLDTIIKNGHYHDRLNKAGIFKVREFLWKLGRSSQGILWEILGTSMLSADLEALVKHATTCDLSGKYFVYYGDPTKSSGVVFENIFQLCGLIEGGVYYSAENLSDKQKLSADTWIREACDNECHRWKHIEEYDMDPSKWARSSPTDVVTGAPEFFDVGQKVPTPFRAPVASRVPAVGDDIFKVLADLPSPHPSQQDGGNVNMGTGQYLLESVLSDHSEQASLACFKPFTTDDDPRDHSEQADGTIELRVEGERERFPPTDRVTWADIQTWVEENSGNDQQDSTLCGTPVASGDQALVNQWLDVGGEIESGTYIGEI